MKTTIQHLRNVLPTLRKIFENGPAGGTVELFPELSNIRFNYGYVYSLAGREKLVKNAMFGDVVCYIGENIGPLQQPGNFLGWSLEKKCFTCFDVSRWEDDIFRAVVYGIHNGQRSLYDIERAQTFNIPAVDRSTFSNERRYHHTVAKHAADCVEQYLLRPEHGKITKVKNSRSPWAR